jgi:hypothetical protein
MLRYAYYFMVFHIASLLEKTPRLSFRLWIKIMTARLNAAKLMRKELESDYSKMKV